MFQASWEHPCRRLLRAASEHYQPSIAKANWVFAHLIEGMGQGVVRAEWMFRRLEFGGVNGSIRR